MKKIISVIGLVITGGLALLMGYMCLMEGRFFLAPYCDTEFASGYSPDKFDLIKVGMSKAEVIKIVGLPLHEQNEFSNPSHNTFYYTDDGKLYQKAKLRGWDWYGDFAWYRSSVTFDTTDMVVKLDKGWSFD